MNLTINKKKENPLLQRTEVHGTIAFDKTTPSNNEVIELLAKELQAAPACIVIKNINTLFGQHNATVQAYIYNSEELRAKTEKVTSHQRKKMEEATKKAAA